jgi:hypothetical protein
VVDGVRGLRGIRQASAGTIAIKDVSVPVIQTPDEEAKVVSVAMRIKNVPYDAFQNDALLEKKLRVQVKETVAQQAGFDISGEYVDVKMASSDDNSMVIQATVSPPGGVSTSALRTSLTALTSDPQSSDHLAHGIAAIPGVKAISTGIIVVKDGGIPRLLSPGKHDDDVSMSMRLKNLIYKAVMSRRESVPDWLAPVRRAFGENIKAVIAHRSGFGVLPEDISIAVAEGAHVSVVLDVSVTPPTGISSDAVALVLSSTKSDPKIGDILAKSLMSIADFKSITKGELVVEDISMPCVQSERAEDETVSAAMMTNLRFTSLGKLNLMPALTRQIKHAVAENIGFGIEAKHVHVKLAGGRPGESIVQVTVKTPMGVSSGALQTAMKALASDVDVSRALMQELNTVPGVSAAVEGGKPVTVYDIGAPTIHVPGRTDSMVSISMRLCGLRYGALRNSRSWGALFTDATGEEVAKRAGFQTKPDQVVVKLPVLVLA